MIKLFNVREAYMDYLRSFEPKVLENKNEQRPYVGIVCEVDSINYYVPLSSPKSKFKNMKNSKDFHKIAEGKYGVINFNKMIPIEQSQLLEIDIENHSDESYKILLRNQHRELVSIQETICKKATEIYVLYQKTGNLTPFDAKVKARCCNFPLLEEKMKEYCSDIDSEKMTS